MKLQEFRAMTEDLPGNIELLVDISDEANEVTSYAHVVLRIDVTSALHINGLMSVKSINLQVST
jgi:hypothetical protein